MFIRSVDENAIAGLGATNDKDVVVHRADHDGMDFVSGFGKEQRHRPILAGDWSLRGAAGSWEQSLAGGSGRPGHLRSLIETNRARDVPHNPYVG
jgi:hypothetical protein